MEALGIYCLKTGLILILFLVIYYFCLQRETFYRFNRFFLLAGLVIALLLPFVPIHYTVAISNTCLSADLITESDPARSAAENNAMNDFLMPLLHKWLPVIYVTGLCFFLIIRMTGMSYILGLIRKNNHRQFPRYRMIESPDFRGAFSFFRFIFIPEQLDETEKKIILKHEEAHVVQNHWADLLLLHLASIIWWFNPVIWLYGKIIRNNHEYLADQAVLTHWEQLSYQKVLVNQWCKAPVFPMAHSFSYSNNLKRINMMRKNTSKPIRKLFALTAIPAIAALLWFFAEPSYMQAQTPYQQEAALPLSHLPETRASVLSEMLTTNTPDPSFRSQDSVMPAEDNHPLYIIDGKKAKEGIKHLRQEDIHAFQILKDKPATDKYGDEGKNGVIEITTRANHDKTNRLTFKNLNMKENPLIIVDGKQYDKGFEQINPDDILSISVLKDKTAGEIYGEEGKNGVILIKTKEKNSRK